jgi:type I restriction-modification system DNA methylase subunit
VLGLLFLKYISDSFEARRDELKDELAADGITGEQAERLLEDRDEYTAERVFWVPPEARWQNIQNQAAGRRSPRSSTTPSWPSSATIRTSRTSCRGITPAAASSRSSSRG